MIANSSMNFVIFFDNANFGSVVVFNERDQQLRSSYKIIIL